MNIIKRHENHTFQNDPIALDSNSNDYVPLYTIFNDSLVIVILTTPTHFIFTTPPQQKIENGKEQQQKCRKLGGTCFP